MGRGSIPDLIPWIPRLWPLLPPRSTPTIDEQLRCPPGSHRELGRGCVPDSPPPPPTVVELPGAPPPPREPRPGARPPKSDDAFVGPVPVPVPVPQPTPAPAPTTSSPVDRTTGRYFPRDRTTRLPTLPEAASRAGLVLWVLGSFVFSRYFDRSPLERAQHPAPSGPPRRTTRGRIDTLPAPRPWPADPYPDYRPLPGFPRIPFPLPTESPRATHSPRGTVRPRVDPRALPRPRTAVPTVPAPVYQPGVFEPIPGPGYDPFVVAPPTPAPRSVPRSTPGRRSPVRLPVWWPGQPVLPGTGAPGRVRPGPLTPQQPTSSPRPRPPLTPQRPPQPTLTPVNDPMSGLSPQPGFRKASPSDPCTEARAERRRNQRECKRFGTKTIRVCVDRGSGPPRR